MSVLAFPLSRPRSVSLPILIAALLTGILTVAVAAPPKVWLLALHLGWFLTGLGLAAPLLIAMHDLSNARWHEPIRPIAAQLANLLPIGGAFIFLALLFGGFYPRVDGDSFRALWLARPFFLARAVAYLALWIFFSKRVIRRRFSAAFVVIFGFTIWLASVDWIMALDGAWASTIFGIYHFAGLFTAGIALMTLIAVSRDSDSATLHDLGTLLFTFSTFWMYIWFSQYMLIWYGNMPEESGYFAERLRGNWGVLFLINVLLNWVIPFVVLLPQSAKRSRVILFRVAAIVLVGHWLDLYLSIFPSRLDVPALGPSEIVAASLAAILLIRCSARSSEAPRHQG